VFENNFKINELYVKILGKGVKEQVLEIKKLNESGVLTLVPRIVDFFEDLNAVVMERVKGYAFSKALFFYTLPVISSLYEDRILGYMRKIGSELGRLHRFTKKGMLRIGDMNLSLITEVKSSPYLCTLIGADLFESIQNKVEEIENERVPFVQIHRDPTPHNILVNGDDVFLVDFAFRLGASFEDTLAFSTGLELMENRLPFFSKFLLEKMKYLFFNHYEKSFHFPFEGNFWILLKLLRTLQQLIVYRRRSKNLKRYVIECIDKRYLLKRVKELSLKLNLR
ncbi:hypothetical protein DRO56_03485, partial [Candidatus Bathyarchaeota archaeon]